MKSKSNLNKYFNLLVFILSFFCLVVLWNKIADFYNPILFPKVQDILISLKEVSLSLDTYINLFASFKLVMKGFLLSLLIAFPTAIFCYKYKLFSKIVLPYHEFIRYIPVPALVPLCAAIFGVEDLTKVMLVFIGTYFQLIFLFIADFEITPKGFSESAKTLGLNRLELITKISVRASLPNLLDSMRITFAWAWSYLLVAEVINSTKGIGYLVLQSYRTLNMPRLISYLIIIGLFGILMDFIFKKIRIKFCPYIAYE